MELPLPADDPTQRRPDITLARAKLGREPKARLRAPVRLAMPRACIAPGTEVFTVLIALYW